MVNYINTKYKYSDHSAQIACSDLAWRDKNTAYNIYEQSFCEGTEKSLLIVEPYVGTGCQILTKMLKS